MKTLMPPGALLMVWYAPGVVGNGMQVPVPGPVQQSKGTPSPPQLELVIASVLPVT